MKKESPVFAILLVLFMLACSAGCSSKETPSLRETAGRPSVTMTSPPLNNEGTLSHNERSIPSPPAINPRISPGSTIPVPTGTTGTMVYENLSELMVTAQEISAAWDPDGLSCNAKSCTAGFVNSNGDSVQVRTALYESADLAKTAYYAEKQEDSVYKIIALDIPDESYGWMQKSQSSVVFRNSNAVVIVDYYVKSGPASVNIAKEFAGMYAQNL